jgi:hypothetical protein
MTARAVPHPINPVASWSALVRLMFFEHVAFMTLRRRISPATVELLAD